MKTTHASVWLLISLVVGLCGCESKVPVEAGKTKGAGSVASQENAPQARAEEAKADAVAVSLDSAAPAKADAVAVSRDTAAPEPVKETKPSRHSAYYKEHPQFHPFPEETKPIQTIDRFGPVGMAIELRLPAFQMRVKSVEPGSPAAATAKLKPGQVIESINGQVMKDEDPRVILGRIITEAEAKDGKVKFKIKGMADEVVVTIPVLGAYSDTWPLECPKSERIVRNMADFLARKGSRGWGSALFLLSTGEEKDLAAARGKLSGGGHTWHIGYGGVAVCEYYLRTGDKSLLPRIQGMVNWLKANQYNDAWGGRGKVPFKYMAGGHMNAAGVHATTFLLLAKECGVDVDDRMLHSALKHFFRYAGRGNVSYGDGVPEMSFVDNGKTGGLAFTMAAAAALTPDGEKSIYARARDISAMKSFYSTSWMNHGHTGGGIGEIWRGAANGLLYHKQPERCRELMDARLWAYELSRRFDGSFGIIGGGGYDKPVGNGPSGQGFPLVYTVPRRKLRIFGAPPTRYSKSFKLPERPWGNEGDDLFCSLEQAPGGRDLKVADEKYVTHASWPLWRMLDNPDTRDADILAYARHPEIGIRQTAANGLGRQKRWHLLPILLKDKDPRVRHAATMAMYMQGRNGYRIPEDKFTDELVNLLFDMVNDPDEAWFGAAQAMEILQFARPELIAPHVDRLAYWMRHDEWWLRKAAMSALTPVSQDRRYYETIWPITGKMVETNTRAVALSPLGGMAARLKDADPEVQAFAARTLGESYRNFPTTMTAPGGVDMSSAVESLLGNIVNCLSRIPGGLDVLYEVSKKRVPDQALPYKDLYLNSPILDSSPKVKGILRAITLNELIPAHVAGNREQLLKLAASGAPRGGPGGRFDQMAALVRLYRKAGIEKYEWTPYGTDRHDNEWEYFTFGSPEDMVVENERTPRYREVTYPKGMENWSVKDFDAEKAGWKKGRAPFANFDNKLPGVTGCTNPACGCGDAGKTLWDKEVLLMRRAFDLPRLKKGYRYRMLVGGASHVGVGDGYRVYINGRKITEVKSYGGRGSGGEPDGSIITKDFFDEFKGGKVVVAATSFLRQHHRSHKIQGNINIWFQQMKLPPIPEAIEAE